jgi:hypothetical protein
MSGIAFALNYPTEFELIRYNIYTKKYQVRYLENIGWHHLELDEKLVRSCMITLGPKDWVKTDKTSYEQLFGGK